MTMTDHIYNEYILFAQRLPNVIEEMAPLLKKYNLTLLEKFGTRESLAENYKNLLEALALLKEDFEMQKSSIKEIYLEKTKFEVHIMARTVYRLMNMFSRYLKDMQTLIIQNNATKKIQSEWKEFKKDRRSRFLHRIIEYAVYEYFDKYLEDICKQFTENRFEGWLQDSLKKFKKNKVETFRSELIKEYEAYCASLATTPEPIHDTQSVNREESENETSLIMD